MDKNLGKIERIRPVGTLTGSYVASNIVNLGTFSGVSLIVDIGTAQTSKVVSVKPQWGFKDENNVMVWIAEPRMTDAAASAGEIVQTPSARVISVQLDSANAAYMGGYIERFNRLAEFFRVLVKSDGVTTGTIGLRAQPCNNY